jgi:Flp pilus assembly protein TadG
MNKSGQSLLEATFGLVIIVFIVIALVDLGIVLYAVSLNDSVCRTAASAAAAGRVEDADHRAQLAIEQTTTNGYGFLISQIELVPPVEVKITSQPIARRDPETGQLFNPGGSVTGTVTVRTKVEIRPFAMDFVFRRCKPLMFSSAQTFPVRYVIPAN